MSIFIFIFVCLLVASAIAFFYPDNTDNGPRPDRPLRPVIDEWDTKKAVHEARHLYAAWMCSSVLLVDCASIEKSGDTDGRVSYVFRDDNSKDALWCKIVISLAGMASEMLAYGKIRSGHSEYDLQKSREIAEKLSAMYKPSERIKPFWTVDEASSCKSLEFEKMFADKLSERESVIFCYAYLKARDVLKAHSLVRDRATSALLSKKTLKESDLVAVLGSRGFTTAIPGPVFVDGKAS